MKKNYLKFPFIVLAFTFLFSSCNKDDENDGPSHANLSIEENKANLEKSGQDMVSEMRQLSDISAIDAIKSLTTRDLDSAFDENTDIVMKSPALNVLFEISNAADRPENFSRVFKALKANEGEDSMLEIWNDVIGTYTWNFTTKKWDYASGASTVILKFPSTETGTVNNAVYTISSFKGASYTVDGYEGDFPTEIKCDLKVDNVVVLSFDFAGTYQNDGVPTKLSSTLTVDAFIFNISLLASASEVSYGYSLKHDSKVLLDFGVKGYGNFTRTNLDNAGGDGSLVQDVVTKVESHYQIMDVVVGGSVDITNLESAINAIDEQYENEENDDPAQDEIAAKLNQYCSLNVFYASDKVEIAKAEAYTKMETDTYYKWVYDEQTEEYDFVEVTDTYNAIDLRFIFPDESKSDQSTYFGSGFTSLENDINEFMEEMETKYGEDNSGSEG